MRIVIHVGLHKCASTFLQKNIFPAISGEKVTYFRDVHRLADVINSGSEDEYARKKSDLLDFLQSRYQFDDLKMRDDKNIFLISSEVLCKSSKRNNCDIRIKRIYDVFPESEIIIIIRNQIDYIDSIYRQNIKEGSFSKDFDSFLEEFRCGLYNLDYADILEEYYKYYRKDRINLFYLENLRRNPRDFVESVLDCIGIAAPGNIDIKPVNEKFSSSSVAMMLRYYRIFGAPGKSRGNKINQIRAFDIPHMKGVPRHVMLVKKIASKIRPSVLMGRVLFFAQKFWKTDGPIFETSSYYEEYLHRFRNMNAELKSRFKLDDLPDEYV